MSMQNSDEDFFGRQENEKILYVVRPHHMARIFTLIKIYAVAILLLVVLVVLGKQIQIAPVLFYLGGIVLSVATILFGTKLVGDYHKREVAYITDRRLVRFDPTTMFATNSRALTWDEVVKVKTYPPNMLWKQMAIGNVVVHARTPGRPDAMGHGDITADDIILNNVYYYRDLGNYIDKILFTYKQKPIEMDSIRPFVAKPRGERY